MLFPVVAEIEKGQNHDRQAWPNGRGRSRGLLRYWRLATPAIAVNRARKLVAAPGNRVDQVWDPQGGTERPDLCSQVAFFDDPARPNAAHQLIFADDRPVGLDQCYEHVVGAPAELYRPAVGKNFAAMRQDPETAELDARRSFGHGIHKD